jgi:hypothetical protein
LPNARTNVSTQVSLRVASGEQPTSVCQRAMVAEHLVRDCPTRDLVLVGSVRVDRDLRGAERDEPAADVSSGRSSGVVTLPNKLFNEARYSAFVSSRSFRPPVLMGPVPAPPPCQPPSCRRTRSTHTARAVGCGTPGRRARPAAAPLPLLRRRRSSRLRSQRRPAPWPATSVEHAARAPRRGIRSAVPQRKCEARSPRLERLWPRSSLTPVRISSLP